MSSRKILVLAIALPLLGATVYSVKYSGKVCGGENAQDKKYQCPRMYGCVLESNKPNAMGVCRFLPNGLRLWAQKPVANIVVETPPEKDPAVEYNTQTKIAQKLAMAQNRFGFELLKNLAYSDQANSQNVLISPASVELALSILYNGANGPTKDQMSSVLENSGFSLIELNNAADYLLSRLNANISNALWVKPGIELNPTLIQDAQKKYNAQVVGVDFSDPNTPTLINDWVLGNTASKILDIVPSTVDQQNVAYITSAAYFTKTWKYKFDPSENRGFIKQDGSVVQVPAMHMSAENFLYFEDSGYQFIKLPFEQDEKYSLVAILPKETNINELLGKLSTTDWLAWQEKFVKREGNLYLPKFKIEYGAQIKESLKGIGLTLPFDKELADFNNLLASSSERPFYISEVAHKTSVEISEEGLETPPPIPPVPEIKDEEKASQEKEPPFTLDINKPFFYAIYNEETQANVLVGIVRGL